MRKTNSFKNKTNAEKNKAIRNNCFSIFVDLSSQMKENTKKKRPVDRYVTVKCFIICYSLRKKRKGSFRFDGE